ncbi:MAG: hypothetical protein IKT21_04195, partial [Methanomicrobium sp.]|nr:hypothetical protein [Methanomicrobium sp.]
MLLLILCIFACGCVSSDTGGDASPQSRETGNSGGMANPTETADAAGNGNQVAVTPAQGVNTAGNPQSAGAAGTGAESDGSGAYAGDTKIADADTKIYPVLVPDAAYQGQSVRRTFNTKFENKIFTIAVDVDMSLLKGARNADKSLGKKIARQSPEVQYKFYRSYFDGMA